MPTINSAFLDRVQGFLKRRSALHSVECRLTSVVTPKPANGGQGKTGQREEAGDSVVLPCSLLWRQVHFRAPTPRTTFEYMTMMEEAIEHGGDGRAVSQQFAPVVYGAVRGEQSTGALIASHDDLQQF